MFYVSFNALLGYIRTATSEGMRDELKDEIPFRHTLAGCEPTERSRSDNDTYGFFLIICQWYIFLCFLFLFLYLNRTSAMDKTTWHLSGRVYECFI